MWLRVVSGRSEGTDLHLQSDDLVGCVPDDDPSDPTKKRICVKYNDLLV